MSIKLYHYDADGALARVTEARLDPLSPEPRPLVPARATIIAPPQSWPANQVPRWDAVSESWDLVDDYRKVPWWAPDDPVTGASLPLGERPPADAVFEAPPSEDEGYRWDGRQWVIPMPLALARAQAAKRLELLAAYRMADRAPLSSTALTGEHEYPMTEADEGALVVLVVGGAGAMLLCSTAGAPLAARTHTPVQLQTLATDLARRKSALLTTRVELDAAVEAAVTVAEVGAVQWVLQAGR